MSESGSDEFDPTAPEQRQIGREMVDDSTGLGSVMAHCYRGEMGRVTTWRQRLDQTTTWAVTVMAAILTWAFSSSDNPHYILLIGIVVVTVFLAIEARRYRDYDVFRSRVRLLQENLFANALDPSQDVERKDWRAELSADFRVPTVKVSLREALDNRLRRVYLPLLGILLAATNGKIPTDKSTHRIRRRKASGSWWTPSGPVSCRHGSKITYGGSLNRNVHSYVPEYKRPPLGVKVIVGHSFLAGLVTIWLAFAASPLYLGLSILAFGTALGLWTEQEWGTAAGILLYVLELGRNTVSVVAGGKGVSAIIAAALSLVVIVYLIRQRYHERIR